MAGERARAATEHLVVVGASLAGLRAAQAARRAGHDGRITLVGAEPHAPYDRLPLSKAFLTEGAACAEFLGPDELAALRIDLRTGAAATGLDLAERSVEVGAESIPFDRLVIATGAAPRTVPTPPGLAGVLTLRTLDDGLALRERLATARDVVVIGAGFIGSEIASAAHAMGASVTIVEAAPVPLVRAVGETVGRAIARLHPRNGVRLVTGAPVASIEGEQAVSGVVLDGGERLPADLVVVGIGAAPATGWLAGSGMALHERDGGILCDETLETSIEGVFAAGDAVHWPNAALGTTMRLENWTNAADQGVHAGRNAVAAPSGRLPYATVPYFWSEWHGVRIQFAGTADANVVEIVEGSVDDDGFVAFHGSAGRLVGVTLVGGRRPIARLRRHIERRGTWDDALALLGR